jgi:hypothetical protein
MAPFLVVLALVGCFPSTALAQGPPDWTLEVEVGKPLFVTMKNGDRIEGLAGNVAVDGITIATPAGIRTGAFTDIDRVEKRDPVWNGVLIGGAVGAGLGLVALLGNSGCPNNDRGCESEAAALPVGGALYGALIGWGLDALVKGRRTIFSDRTPTRLAFGLKPHVASAHVRVIW